MSGTVAIVGFFVGLIVIIMIHEGGHYLTARLFGFRVLEYFVGFGPRVWSFRRGEIEYGLKAIPAGGYVKIAGMNPLQNDVPPGDEPRAYYAKPIWQRAIVILAGPASHFMVAGLVFASLYLFVGDLSGATRVGDVSPTIDGRTSPAAAAGLQPGDTIVQVGDVADPTPAELGEYQRAHLGEPIPFVIDRDGTRLELTMTPVVERMDGEQIPRIGVLLAPVPRSPVGAFTQGYADVWNFTKLSVGQIGRVFGPEGIGRVFTLLVTDEERAADDPTSVVGIGQQVGAIGSQGDWDYVVLVFGYVTLFIGLINLVPLPPFDGGHLAVLLIERIRGRAVDMKKLIPVSAVVLIFLVTFVFATAILDFTKPVPFQP